LNIRERLLASRTIDLKFQILEENLLQCYLNKLQQNPFVDFAISKILACPNQVSIKEISQNVGFSHKHVCKIFKENVGVTPKAFLKIIRFQKAIQQIEEQRIMDWSAIAYDCGFYDQSHFIADFKVFSGFTPTEYIKQKGETLNYIPIK
jgi:AraC-like DNA-binding protein